MNKQELFLLRKEIIQAVAVMQPELKVELEAMEKVYVKTQAAADIIGTADAAAKIRKDAEDYAYGTRAAADKILEEVKTLQNKVKIQEESVAKMLQDAVAAKNLTAKLLDEQTSSSAAHAARVASETAALAEHRKVLEDRSDKLDSKAQGLTERERELSAKLAKMRAITA